MKQSISIDVQRSILQHLMFGVLAVLILMNWSVHKQMDCGMFIESFDCSANQEIENSIGFYDGIITNYDIEGGSARLRWLELANYINSQTDYIVGNLELLLSKSNAKIMDIELTIFDDIVTLRDSLHSSYGFSNEIPFSDNDIASFKSLYDLRTSPLIEDPINYQKVLLYSLRQDILKVRSVYFEFISSNMHDQTMWFQGYHSKVIFDTSNLNNYNFKASILLSEGLPRHRTGIYTAEANYGHFDSIVKNDIFEWNNVAKNLGHNTVNGSIRFKHRDIDVTRPFSFSYFVSAPGIAMHLDKANLCYVAVDNPVRISIPGYPAEKVQLKVAHAKVTKKKDGSFEIYFDQIPKSKVYAYVEATNEQGRTSKVHSLELRAKELPPPITNFEEYKESGITIDSFFAQESLLLFTQDAAFEIAYEVISFDVEVISHNHQYIGPLTVYGAAFSNNHELLSVLNTVAPGDRLILSNIKATASNRRMYQVQPLSILLK